MHSLIGYIVVIITAYAIWQAFENRRRTIVIIYHSIFGLLTYIFELIVVAIGMTAMVKRKFISRDWETAKLIWWAKVHSYLAYFLIFFSQITVTLGLLIFYKQVMKTSTGILLASLNFFGFWGILIAAEIYH